MSLEDMVAGIFVVAAALITALAYLFESRGKQTRILKDIEIYKEWKSEARTTNEKDDIDVLRCSISDQVFLLAAKKRKKRFFGTGFSYLLFLPIMILGIVVSFAVWGNETGTIVSSILFLLNILYVGVLEKASNHFEALEKMRSTQEGEDRMAKASRDDSYEQSVEKERDNKDDNEA